VIAPTGRIGRSALNEMLNFCTSRAIANVASDIAN
jgi:hypothetical protein